MRGEGRVFQRKNIWWIAYSRNGKEHRESSGSTSEFVAQLLLKKRLSHVLDLHSIGKKPLEALYGPLTLKTIDREHVEWLIRRHAQPFKPLCGLYFLLSFTTIVYVGRSTDIMTRIARHRSEEKAFTDFAYLECSEEEAKLFERWCIALLQPQLNIFGRGFTPPEDAPNPFTFFLNSDTERTLSDEEVL